MIRIKFKTKQDQINGFYELATKGRARSFRNGTFEITTRYLKSLDDAGIGYEIIQAEDGRAGEFEAAPTFLSHLGETSMQFNVVLDRDEDGMWIVECPAIPGCVSQGKTKQEALKNIKAAIQLCLEVRAERGLPLTIEKKWRRERSEVLSVPPI